jgi:hypothetical protein
MVAFDWSNITAISYTFRVETTSEYATKQNQFNQTYSDELSIATDLADMFAMQDGVKTIVQDPFASMRMKICENITAYLKISDEGLRDEMKNHVGVLMAPSTFKHMENGRQIFIRNEEKLTQLAAEAYSRGEKKVEVDIDIEHWMFRKDWKPTRLYRVYCRTHEEPSDDKSSNAGNNDAGNVLTQGTRDNDQIFELLENQQTLMNNIAQITARNNDD